MCMSRAQPLLKAETAAGSKKDFQAHVGPRQSAAFRLREQKVRGPGSETDIRLLPDTHCVQGYGFALFLFMI